MELMTVIVILGILSVMVFSTVGSIKGKAARGKCASNLKVLYAAGAAYLQDNGSWPQISVGDVEDPSFAKAWIAAFRPYKLSEVNWTCSTVQTAMGNPPQDPNSPRIDYIPTSFDAKPSSPWLYPTHPWFIERADVHGDGNLLIFANGQIHTLRELSKATSTWN
jgi:type II secretory pathway pseudopilin PulG